MTTYSPKECETLADKLVRIKPAVAQSLTERFCQRHPEWLERYGERGRQLSVEDTGHHLDFLAGAVLSQAVASIVDYAQWNVRMFGARNIGPLLIVETFSLIGEILTESLTTEEWRMIQPYIAAACSAAENYSATARTDDEQGKLTLVRKVFLQAILKGQRKAALNVALEAVRDGFTLPDIYVDVFQESLYEVGRNWEANQICVAEEHMATAITQYVIAQMYQAYDPPMVTRGRMVITGVQGEFHQVGAVMVADVMESEGWDVRYLGTNMPHEGIIKAIEEHRADVVGISTTILANVSQAIRLVEDIRRRFTTHPPRIVLGGSAFRMAPELVENLKVSGYAKDLRDAQQLLRAF